VKKRVLFICPNGEFGGAERTALNLISELNQRGNWSTEVVLLRHGHLEHELNARKISFHIIEGFRLSQPLSWHSVIKSLKKIFDSNKSNLIHAEMAYGQIVAGLLSLVFRTPSVWYQHGPVTKWSLQQKVASILPAKGYLTNSNYTLNQQPSLLFNSLKRVLPPPLGREFTSTKQDRSLRSTLGIDADETLLLLPARFQSRFKGQIFAIESFFNVAKKNPKARFVLLGAPEEKGHRDYHDYLEAKAAADSLNVKVKRTAVSFAPFDSQIIRWLDAADLVLSATLIAEPFGCTIVEAMSRGKLVVAPRLGGIIDIATKAPGIFHYESGKQSSLAGILERAISLPDHERQRIGEMNRAAAANFSVDRIVPQLESFYDEVCAPLGKT
jgi:glycosyltransferase involved in cell wall biosynthesis